MVFKINIIINIKSYPDGRKLGRARLHRKSSLPFVNGMSNENPRRQPRGYTQAQPIMKLKKKKKTLIRLLFGFMRKWKTERKEKGLYYLVGEGRNSYRSNLRIGGISEKALRVGFW